MLTYAGVDLVQPDAGTLSRLEDGLPLWLASHRAAWTLPRLPGDAAQGTPGLWPPARPRINSLYWPSGASRWACGWFVADEAVLAAARLAQATAGSAAFAFSDGTASMAADLSMLPALPLERVSPSFAGLWLLPLVDDRWRWWQASANVAVTGGTTTWAALYALAGTALGVTITADAVDSAYLMPSPSLGGAQRRLPLLLDAVAASVGQRIVRRHDGTVLALSAQSSLAVHLANLAANDASRLLGQRLDVGGY